MGVRLWFDAGTARRLLRWVPVVPELPAYVIVNDDPGRRDGCRRCGLRRDAAAFAGLARRDRYPPPGPGGTR